MARLASVDPSSTTRQSSGGRLCANTEFNVSASQGSALWQGITREMPDPCPRTGASFWVGDTFFNLMSSWSCLSPGACAPSTRPTRPRTRNYAYSHATPLIRCLTRMIPPFTLAPGPRSSLPERRNGLKRTCGAQLRTRVVTVLDFRDSWSINPLFLRQRSRVWRAINARARRMIETIGITNASAVTFATEPLRRAWLRFCRAWLRFCR